MGSTCIGTCGSKEEEKEINIQDPIMLAGTKTPKEIQDEPISEFLAPITDSRMGEKKKYVSNSRAKEEDHLAKQKSGLEEEIKASDTFAEYYEAIELSSKLINWYEEPDNTWNKIKLDRISVTEDNYKQVERIPNERKNSIDCIEEEKSKLLLILAQEKIKEDTSNVIVWLDYKKSKIVFINLDTKIPYLKMKPPPEIKIGVNRHFSGGPSLVKVNAYAYFLGGFTGEESLNTLFRMSIKDPYKEFIKLQSMKVSRHDIAAAQLIGRYLYAITGSVFVDNDEVHTKECEVYNIEKDTWKRIHPVNVGAAVSGICTFNERYIFIYGGQIVGPSNINRIESHDTLDDERGWILHKISESVMNCIPGTSILMHQISTKEIIIAFNDKFTIVELQQETIVKSKEIQIDYKRIYYPAIQFYRGKVFYTNRDYLYEYDTIKTICFLKSMMF